MNYPVWELDTIGGGTLVAFISVIHAYVAQFAVGGGFYIWWLERRARRAQDPALMQVVKRHTRFFMLLTMVFGGVSGVGIWFIIGLVQPAATSMLIHTFVFGWAIEWVFFIVEIVALIVLYYRFDTLEGPVRSKIAMIYALAAWLSLVVINGILAFMLTPGTWLESRYFWDGFFNPSYVSSTFLRTFLALMLAGIFATITVARQDDDELRKRLARGAAAWVWLPALGFALCAYWYYLTIEPGIRERLLSFNPDSSFWVTAFWAGGAAVMFLGALLFVRLPRKAQGLVSILILAAGLTWYGGLEFLREHARRPWIIHGAMYSNSVLPEQVDTLNRDGVLSSARWVRQRKITDENRAQVGQDLFRLQCLACHTAGGWRNDVMPLTKELTVAGAEALLAGLGQVRDYMPPFVGNAEERRALAVYLTVELHAKPDMTVPTVAIQKKTASLPERVDGDYQLLVWNDLGMHCISDAEGFFVILPPANTIEAQLIKRGESPELISEGVTLHYTPPAGHEHPENHVAFWKHAKALLGKDLPAGVGLSGKGMSGTLEWDEGKGAFVARHIPVVPYRDDGSFDPYPVFTVSAKDEQSGRILASTRVVTPTSTEMRCLTCHGGSWRHKDGSGLSDQTAANILAVHDRNHGTQLLAEAREGRPAFCQKCHSDAALGMKGQADRLSLSAAIHGWHANAMHLSGKQACASCHPAHPQGATRCLRDVHVSRKVGCPQCHGDLAEHAAGLLMAERDKPSAGRLLAKLKVSRVKSLEQVEPRKAWVQQPDCLNCHQDFEAPKKGATGYNRWTESAKGLFRMRTGEAGVRCSACHGSPHALYPAVSPTQTHLDNYQPLAASGMPYPLGSNQSCQVCHLEEMEDSIHHPNMENTFRGKWLEAPEE